MPSSEDPSSIFRRVQTAPASTSRRLRLFPRQQVLKASQTLPDTTEPQEIKRTSSGGLLFRKKSSADQEEVSRARAQELVALYEANSIETTLIKSPPAVETRFSPRLAPAMSVQQAVAAYQQREAEHAAKASVDPLLTDRERQSLNPTSRPPLKEQKQPRLCNPSDVTKPRSWQRQELARAQQVTSALESPRESASQGVEVTLQGYEQIVLRNAYHIPNLC